MTKIIGNCQKVGLENMEKNFETEVLTRLAVIENKLNGYSEIKKSVYEITSKSENNQREIEEIKLELGRQKNDIDEQKYKPGKKWDKIISTIISTAVGGIVGAIIALILK